MVTSPTSLAAWIVLAGHRQRGHAARRARQRLAARC